MVSWIILIILGYFFPLKWLILFVTIIIFLKSLESKDLSIVDMDCMAFGMGCCCLQITFQARDLNESRDLYDQLAVLAPIMLALSAACPILKGTLVNTEGLPGPDMIKKFGKFGIIKPKYVAGPFFQYLFNLIFFLPVKFKDKIGPESAS